MLVANWNERVLKGDVVYHLGDFALSWGSKHGNLIGDLLARLNGQKHLITGNHDRSEVTKSPLWAKVRGYAELKIDTGGIHKQRIVMFHYPLRSWNQMHRGAWMLHGHSHGNLSDVGGRILDVGVDCHDYSPVSFDDVKKFMEKREFLKVDHHEAKD